MQSLLYQNKRFLMYESFKGSSSLQSDLLLILLGQAVYYAATLFATTNFDLSDYFCDSTAYCEKISLFGRDLSLCNWEIVIRDREIVRCTYFSGNMRGLA